MIRPRGPVLVFKQNTKRESGRKAQLANIQARKAIADIVRTTLGPSSMLKMLLCSVQGEQGHSGHCANHFGSFFDAQNAAV
ncbi:hypothetical protein, conserved [Eimeria tenella]|uniref:Uncharacterized protein n=1 Tax=Eimeria tenella TaxID=5802 RepID=U6LBI8_EIMTE|nr:hypothetical protein, conserved [Eimeria tenella]CDJ45125.1 hypothetical protein, conserved [Eimeria tenella]|eukprot:XP_013235872.1 hypothetical protein, conserved [Eimeria tenella]